MSKLRYDRAPTIEFLSELAKQIVAGELLIPRFQREFVWKDEQRISLFESVLEGVPFGSILLWKTNEHRLKCYPSVGPIRLTLPSPTGSRMYLLDGLQRLSTFVGALWSPKSSGLIPGGIGNDRDWDILYDLSNERFSLRSQILPDQIDLCLPLRVVLHSKDYLLFQRNLFQSMNRLEIQEEEQSRLLERADEVAFSIRDTKIPIIFLATDDIASATTSFQRINTAGTKMSAVHMVNALTYSEKFDLLERLEELKPELEREGWGALEPQSILQVCRAISGCSLYEANPEPISKKIRETPEILDLALRSLVVAIRFLRTDCLIGGPQMLPFNILLVCLADVLRTKPEILSDVEKRADLVAWFWISIYSRTPLGIGFGADNILSSLHKIVSGDPSARWWGRVVESVDQLPSSTKLDTYRMAAFVAQLCRLTPRDVSGSPIPEPQTLVALRGGGVLQPLFDVSSSRKLGLIWPKKRPQVAATRVIMTSSSLDIFREQLTELPREILLSHGIDAGCSDALRKGNLSRFFEERERCLLALEQQFLDQSRQRLARFLRTS